MASLQCSKCGAEFSVVQTGSYKYRTTSGVDVTANCVRIKERAEGGKPVSDFDCDYQRKTIETWMSARRH